MLRTMSWVNTLPFDSPRNTSAPLMAFCQSMYIATVGGKVTFLLGQILAVAGDDSPYCPASGYSHGVHRALHTVWYMRWRKPRHRLRDFHFLYLLACHFQGVQQSCAGDDGGAVLVVVHHGDVQFLFQAAFYFETFGCFDVFQVDTSECWGNSLDSFDELVGVFLFTSMSNTSIPA